MQFLFRKNGFEVIDYQTVNRDTHAITVRKRQLQDTAVWQESFKKLKNELLEHVNNYLAQGKKVAVWGASHQGFALLSSLDLGNKISYIIDSATFKQGKYSPASHVPIVDKKHYFEEPVDSIIIMAPGYTDEIVAIIKKELNADLDIRAIRSIHLERI